MTLYCAQCGERLPKDETRWVPYLILTIFCSVKCKTEYLAGNQVESRKEAK